MEILDLIIITLIPGLELRASIPYGIIQGMNWFLVFSVCVVTNIILGVIVFKLIDGIIMIVKKIHVIDMFWSVYVDRTQKRIRSAVKKWGEFAVAVFIAIPLPGSGVYSGALAAYLIGLDFRKFLIANVIGVIVAGAIVAAVSVTGAGIFSLFTGA